MYSGGSLLFLRNVWIFGLQLRLIVAISHFCRNSLEFPRVWDSVARGLPASLVLMSSSSGRSGAA
jgi:hypothetical protein